MRVGDVDVPILFRAGALRFNPSVVLNCSPPGVYICSGEPGRKTDRQPPGRWPD